MYILFNIGYSIWIWNIKIVFYCVNIYLEVINIYSGLIFMEFFIYKFIFLMNYEFIYYLEE